MKGQLNRREEKKERLLSSVTPIWEFWKDILLYPPVSLNIIFIKTPSEITAISGKLDWTSKEAHTHTFQCARATLRGFLLFQLLPNHPPNPTPKISLSSIIMSTKHLWKTQGSLLLLCTVWYPLLGKADFECQFHLAVSTAACFNATYLQIHQSTTNQLLQLTITESTFDPFWPNLIWSLCHISLTTPSFSLHTDFPCSGTTILWKWHWIIRTQVKKTLFQCYPPTYVCLLSIKHHTDPDQNHFLFLAPGFS